MENHIYYKYMSLDSCEKILDTSTLKITDPTLFNDPFDCNFPEYEISTKDLLNIFSDYFTDLLGDTFKQLLKENDTKLIEASEPFINDLRRIINEYLNNVLPMWDKFLKVYRILCLTLDNKNILMWSHYADYHKGIVLGFDFHNNTFFNKITEVKYDDYNKEFAKIITEWIKPVLIDERNYEKLFINKEFKYEMADELIQKLKEYFFIKKEIWKYENECRLVRDIDELVNTDFINFQKENVVEMIFGIRVEEERKEYLLKKYKGDYHGLKFFEAKKQHDKLIINNFIY